MNKRQRKKALKKWLARVRYIEDIAEPIFVGYGAFVENIESRSSDLTPRRP